MAWLPNDSEDEIEFRRLPSDRKPFYDDPSELEGERHSQMTQALDNVLQNEDEIPADELLMAMSKRNPTSVSKPRGFPLSTNPGVFLVRIVVSLRDLL